MYEECKTVLLSTMLCCVCINVLRAPKVIAGPKPSREEIVFYPHHESIFDLEFCVQLRCHLCLLIWKCLYKWDAETQRVGIPPESMPDRNLSTKYYLQIWIPERQLFLVHFHAGNDCFASLRLLSPSCMLDG